MGDRKRKGYNLPEQALRTIVETKREHGFTNDTDALIYILDDYSRKKRYTLSHQEKSDIAQMVMAKFNEQYRRNVDRTKFASAAAERYAFLCLDVLNTLLYESNATFLMKASGETRHQVVRESEQDYQKRLVEAQQKYANASKQGR